jgi:exopolysaccharide production protein ExoY
MTLGVEFGSKTWADDCAMVAEESVVADYRSALSDAAKHRVIPNRHRLELIATRVFDVIAASSLLLAALPALIFLAIALQIDSPGRLFFVQQRIGRGGKMFPCIKFRTMCADADKVLARHLDECSDARREWARDFKLRNDPRITRLGGVVRRFSLDEFPQLLNIIAGHMSVVGPRPIVREEIERYGRFFPNYCAVRPGLTGLWQISGRNDTTYSERVALDCRYVANKSFTGDVVIALKTVPAVLGAKGSY